MAARGESSNMMMNVASSNMGLGGGSGAKKPHPARLLSMKCDTLLNKFRRRVTDPMDSDDENAASTMQQHVDRTVP